MNGVEKTLLISILSLGRQQNILAQLVDLPEWLDDLAREHGLHSHIIVRNNDPNADFAETASRMLELKADYPSLACTLVTNVPNNGFGDGHNSNIAMVPSDYVLILNDDIGFPHISWLGEAIRILQGDARTFCVGGDENPKHLNFAFGNGLLPGAFHLHALPYAEASILLFDRAAFDRLGGFAADFRWAMCEDSDLSMRVQQNGGRIAHISMPHQHWRSTSFNSLPSVVKSSILEHNRAALFANWRDSLTAGRVGRFEVFDIWSDGLGDVFCTLPHVLARLAPLSAERRANILINTSHPELFGWLGLDFVRITSIKDLGQLRAELEADGIASLRSMRDVNFSLPFNIHPLLAGALGIDTAPPSVLADFAAALRRLQPHPAAHHFATGSYCVVHLEFDRNHEGRGLALSMSSALLKLCGQLFGRIVLVGRETRLSAALFGNTDADILDLQGRLSRSQLAAVIAHAGQFVGIDSFPAHVAQACFIPAALFFGAVHPLARTWNEARVWPLTAPLDCIGCYHTHLEASVPFCMRRDVACTTSLQVATMRATLSDMVAQLPYSWWDLARRWHALQAALIKLARFHPAPPERLFRPQIAANEQISNAIYRMTEQMGTLLGGHYHTSTVTALAAQCAELQAELHAKSIALEEARLQLKAPATDTVPPQHATRIAQLCSLEIALTRCRANISDQWIEIDSDDDDPQIALPVLRGGGGKVQLRISCVAASGDALQVYWATDDNGFAAEQVHTLPGSGGMQSTTVMFDLAEGELLHIRIDPTTGAGRARLRGSLGGLFTLPGAPGQEAHAETVPLLVATQRSDMPRPKGNAAHIDEPAKTLARRARRRVPEKEHA